MLMKIQPRTFAATVVVYLAQLAFVVYLGLSAVGIGRDLARGSSARYSLLGLNTGRGTATVFDQTRGEVLVRPLPKELM